MRSASSHDDAMVLDAANSSVGAANVRSAACGLNLPTKRDGFVRFAGPFRLNRDRAVGASIEQWFVEGALVVDLTSVCVSSCLNEVRPCGCAQRFSVVGRVEDVDGLSRRRASDCQHRREREVNQSAITLRFSLHRTV